ncbi:hypothetical protein [Paenibacillus koleovorans]|uniref:hypothetical protein n=1 Tax=Paenibacillus koleovorans TaxID=121608 RepID=UPI000FDB8A93|nr:hypothetical protein [Paenibacillus koleovorans]
MIGTVRWNLALGVLGFGLTFLLSVGDNYFTTTLLHSSYGFIIMFGVGFAVRWVLGTLAGLKELQHEEGNEAVEEAGKGNSVYSVTPNDEAELNELLKNGMNGASAPSPDEFTLLKPKRLTTAPGEPEEMAQALRRFTEE